MQPTPPKTKKPQYKRPFYDSGKKTSAEIISEARKSVKPLDAARPFTPAEPQRSLFGATRPSEGRPPSAFSIGPNAFSEPRVSSRPPTGKLRPLRSFTDLVEGESSIEASGSIQIPPFRGVRSAGELSRQKDSSEIQESNSSRFENEIVAKDNSDLGNHAEQGRRLSFPLPLKSMEPSISKGQRTSPRQSDQVERRAQCGPKERARSRNSDLTGIKKYSSMGSIENKVDVEDSSNTDERMSASRETAVRGAKSRPSSKGKVLIENKDLDISNKSAKDSGNVSARSSTQTVEGDSEEKTRSSSARSSSSVSEGESDDQNSLFKENIEPLLKQMELNHLHGDLSALGVNFDMLWKTLEFCNLLGKGTSSGSARRRTIVLRTVFKFVDADSAEVILKLCKLALAMKVNGKNLVNICKLIFKISKDKSRDELFKEENIISYMLEILNTYDVIQFFDGIVYAVGCVKFLSVNPLLHEDLLQADCIECFGILLKRIIELTAADANMIQLSHLIVQASGAIRNLADIQNTRSRLIKSEIMESLISLLNHYPKDVDYMLNVSRIFSKLTQYGDCCHILYNTSSSITLLIEALKHYRQNKDIAVRLIFVFGNIAAKVESARSYLYFEKNSLPVFLEIIEEYMNKTMKMAEKNDDNENSPDLDQSNEILVKTIRVIANMSIDPSVANGVANNQWFLNLVINILEKKKGKSSEELLINSAATLNNLSYHCDEETHLHVQAKDITSALIQLLFVDNMDCIIEATRVFGNFTRYRDIRTLLRERKVVSMLITLLESSDREVVFSACGVLINLMVDNESRKVLKQDRGIQKLIDAMKDFGQTDWQLSSMICQTLWNYSEKITSAISCFGEDETENLLLLLQDYLDPDIALDYSENKGLDAETKDLMKQNWSEQFEPVGLQLFNRIDENHTPLQPLVDEPD